MSIVPTVNNKLEVKSLYVEKRAENLYFGMERLSQENIIQWLAFQTSELRKAKNLTEADPRNPLGYRLLNGLLGFKDSLLSIALLQKCSPHEVWVLFDSTIPVDQDNLKSFDNIEMSCTVSTSNGLPFTTHMGITRSFRFATNEVDSSSQHKNISMDLHSFGARVMKLRYPHKIHVITTPMPVMEKIFLKALGKQNVSIGFDKDWPSIVEALSAEMKGIDDQLESGEEQDLVEQRSKVEKKLKSYKERITSSNHALTFSTEENRLSFHLKDPQGKTLLQLNNEEMMGIHSWYFTRDSTFTPQNNIVVISLDALASFKNSPAAS